MKIQPLFKPTLRCPCDETLRVSQFYYEHPPKGETSFDLQGQAYMRGYDACQICGHWFGHHNIDLSDLYKTDYVNATYGSAQSMLGKLQKILAMPSETSDNTGRVERIHRFLTDMDCFPTVGTGRLLDIGAGLGVFPAVMRDRGWHCVGIEPDARTVEHLRTNVGIEAHNQPIENLSPQELGSFDLITLNKVIEHVEDPVELLASARRFANTRSFIYIEVPDVAAAIQGASREEFFIEHHHVFSLASLSICLQRSGLRPCQIGALQEPSSKFTLFAFAQTI